MRALLAPALFILCYLTACNGQLEPKDQEKESLFDSSKQEQSEPSINSDTLEIPDQALVAVDPTQFGIKAIASEQTYASIKVEIAAKRQLLAKAYQQKNIDLDSIGRYFEQTLVNQIIPYWYGTPWTFEGHTNIPNQGTIACGYFVSTTLKHMGVNINRYKLAQQWPKNEAQSLDQETTLVEGGYQELLNQMQEGIYFLGLDANHVGYLLKRQKQLFFIHSNYSIPSEVIIQDAKFSDVFLSFSRFYLAKISTNSSLLEAWLKETEIKVVLGD